MTGDTLSTFLDRAFDAARMAVYGIKGRGGLFFDPETISRRMRTRLRAEIERLETLVRRLILLLALSIEVEPSKGPASSEGNPCEDLSAFRQAPALRGLHLSPNRGFIEETEPGTFPALAPSPVGADPAPILARLARIVRVLATPAAHAERLARRLHGFLHQPDGLILILPLAGRARLEPEAEEAQHEAAHRLKHALAPPDTG